MKRATDENVVCMLDAGARVTADHVGPTNARRSGNLRVIVEFPPGWQMKPGVPASRAECPNTSVAPCPFVNCRQHLWHVDGSDRPGRRYGGRTPPSDVRPHSSETCALVGRELSVQEIAARLGCTPRRVQQEIKALREVPAVERVIKRWMRLRVFIEG